MDLATLSVRSVRSALARKEFTARELALRYCDEIESRDGEIKSYLRFSRDTALAAADAADRRLAAGEATAELAGVPYILKDNIVTRGERATAGSRILEPYQGAYDATVFSRLSRAGALMLGKGNMDEFAMGSSTERSAFGPTRNPHDTSRVPGGSSGGPAAAVAARLALVGIGSDTGGSIRQPAALCGVVGLKPTYGRVSRHGLIAMASSLDQIGVFGRSVEDVAEVYRTIAGVDRYDATSSDRAVQPMEPCDMKGVRIGVPKEYFAEGLDPRVRELVTSAVKKFEDAGAVVKEISLPHSRFALPTYYIVMPAEVSANLARFDGLRYGFRAPAQELRQLYEGTREQGFGTETKRRIMIGTYVLSHGYYDAFYLKAQKVRRLIRQDFEQAFKDVDVIMGPTTPSVAFPFGAKNNDPISMYLEDIYTVSINLAGIPALSIPCGAVDEANHRLPVGLQLIGSSFDEARLLGIADAAEKILNVRL